MTCWDPLGYLTILTAPSGKGTLRPFRGNCPSLPSVTLRGPRTTAKTVRPSNYHREPLPRAPQLVLKDGLLVAGWTGSSGLL